MNVLKYIINTYTDKFDNESSLIYHVLKHQRLKLFEKLICCGIINVVNNINVECESWKYWNKGHQDVCRVFLDSIKSVCTTTKCKHKQDVDLLNETIDNALILYANKFK